jgi:hypothetical protein
VAKGEGRVELAGARVLQAMRRAVRRNIFSTTDDVAGMIVNNQLSEN